MIRLIQKLYRLSGEKKRDLRLAIFLQALQAMTEAGIYIVIYQIVLHLLNEQWSFAYFTQASILAAGLFLLRWLLEYSVTSLQSTAGYDIMGDLRLREAEKLKKLPMGIFNGESIGSLLAAFTSDMSYVEMYCMSVVTRFTSGMAVVVITTVMMLFVDWRMTLLAILGFIPAFLIYRQAKKRFAQSGAARQESQREAIGMVLEYATGMETIKTYGLAGKTFQKVEGTLKSYRDTSARYELSALKPMVLYQIFVRLGMGLLFLGGFVLWNAGLISLPVYLFFLIISQKYYGPIETIFLDYGVLNLMGIAFERIDALSALKPMEDTGTRHVEQTNPAFENIRFAYPNSERNALENLSAELLPGCMNAVVGPSGGGKTTLLHMIARFWDADAGQVRIGGTPIQDISYESLMRSVSMVFQDVYLFADTLRENIRMGKPDATDAEIMAAAKKAYCADLIAGLPEGLDTVIGEGGNTLSGGEKQRISIARAILKDAPLILLDEAFSSLDAENAWAIQQAVENMTRSKTVVMIAHTLSYVQDAARIIVIENGRAVQLGAHQDLIAQEGVYRRLWEKEHASKEWRIKSS